MGKNYLQRMAELDDTLTDMIDEMYVVMVSRKKAGRWGHAQPAFVCATQGKADGIAERINEDKNAEAYVACAQTA